MMQSMLSKLNKLGLGNAVVDYLGFEYANFGLADYTEPEGKPAMTSRIQGKSGSKQFRSRWVN